MSCWVIIPVKPPDEGKQRLAGVLNADARNELVRAMLNHVVATVSTARGVDQLYILGSSRHGQSAAIPLLNDPGGGLNRVLAHALCEAEAGGARRVIFIAGDLPLITPRDVEALAQVPAAVLAIASDRHGSGTNALSLPLPEAENFTFAYGHDSFAAHNSEAYRRGIEIRVITTAGLARDVDEPEDLQFAANH